MTSVAQPMFPEYMVPSARAPNDGARGVTAKGMPLPAGVKSQ